MSHQNVLASPAFQDGGVNKVAVFQGSDLTSDTYYFKPNQVLDWHRHPNGDQIFFILKGSGKFHLDDGKEQVIDVTEGSTVFIPAGVWHKLANGGTDMVATQVTKAGAGFEPRA